MHNLRRRFFGFFVCCMRVRMCQPYIYVRHLFFDLRPRATAQGGPASRSITGGRAILSGAHRRTGRICCATCQRLSTTAVWHQLPHFRRQSLPPRPPSLQRRSPSLPRRPRSFPRRSPSLQMARRRVRQPHPSRPQTRPRRSGQQRSPQALVLLPQQTPLLRPKQCTPLRPRPRQGALRLEPKALLQKREALRRTAIAMGGPWSNGSCRVHLDC